MEGMREVNEKRVLVETTKTKPRTEKEKGCEQGGDEEARESGKDDAQLELRGKAPGSGIGGGGERNQGEGWKW